MLTLPSGVRDMDIKFEQAEIDEIKDTIRGYALLADFYAHQMGHTINLQEDIQGNLDHVLVALEQLAKSGEEEALYFLTKSELVTGFFVLPSDTHIDKETDQDELLQQHIEKTAAKLLDIVCEFPRTEQFIRFLNSKKLPPILLRTGLEDYLLSKIESWPEDQQRAVSIFLDSPYMSDEGTKRVRRMTANWTEEYTNQTIIPFTPMMAPGT